ncbi:MAG: DUF4974 domain-containing protein [Sphingobacterium sp.]|jgi:hypothetical protein|nr:DUF4974 domain-containing protein [Sphingobacterium sp.]
MNKLNFNRLVNAYLDGSASDADKALLEAYYEKLRAGESLTLAKEEEEVLQEMMYDDIISAIHILPKKRRIVRLWPRVAIAASLLLTVAIGIWFSTNSNDKFSLTSSSIQPATDFAPGKNTATLTDINGNIIQLSDAKNGIVISEDIRYDDHTMIISNVETKEHSDIRNQNAETGMMKLTTPRGGMYRITLSDGTKVWLNSASRLTYTATLTNNNRPHERSVKLEGEAYFEVVKDKSRPFIVESVGQKVEVLGTHFNVNSYSDNEGTITSLIEGSVRVSSTTNLERRAILVPGQQSVINKTMLTVEKANTNVIAWTQGKFSFYETPIDDVMKQLSRWYNIEVSYPNGIPNKKFTGDINRNVNLSELLGLLEFSGVKVTIKDKKIFVNK